MTTRLIPPGAAERTVAGLRVLEAGPPSDAAPLVLLHGGGTDNAGISWYRLMAPLSADRQVWAIDLPGFGGSIDVPPAGGPGAMADVVADALRALGAPPAIVFGVSMGGDVALHLALEHPDAVAGLVLIAPGGLVPRLRNTAAQYSAWLAAQLPDWLLLPASRLANRFVRTALRAIVKDPTTLPPQVVAEVVREARDPRGGIAYGRYNQATLGPRGMRNDLSDEVSRITVPTLIFHGADDPIVDPAGSQRAAQRMPHARLVMQPNCGHWAQLEAHDAFLAKAQAFLAAV